MFSLVKKFLILICVCFICIGCNNDKNNLFSLDSKYYGNSDFIDIDSESLNKLVENKGNFILFVYQPLCAASTSFEAVLTNFAEAYEIGINKIAFSNIKDTLLGEHVKFYPSFVIFKNGEVVDYLDPNDGKDTEIYKNVENLGKWLSSYVNISLKNEVTDKVDDDVYINENVEITVELKGVSYDSKRVNIYFFWGDGCPHCKKEFAFFEDIEKEYGKYYNLHRYEVWNNDENYEVLKQFAAKLGKNPSAVPFTIIGNKVFIGFDDSYKSRILDAITTQHIDSYDVYFDGKKDKA